MKHLALITLGVAALIPTMTAQNEAIDSAALKKLIEGMGYETRILNTAVGKEKFEFTVKATGFDVPLAAEIPMGKNHIWFSAFLGDVRSDRYASLLKANDTIQPSVFYLNEQGKLLIGVAVENRGVTAAVLKRVTDQVVADVIRTEQIWQ